MKLMKFFSVLMFCIFCCTTYAHENKHIFIGQNGSGESAKTTFLLEVFSTEDLNNSFVMNEDGEIYLKADQIVSIPKEMLADFALMGTLNAQNFAEGAILGRREPVQIRCPQCKMYYTPQPGQGCPNRECPSNR